ncbi:phage holin family protein [Christensenellaceae bacterium 44-20]
MDMMELIRPEMLTLIPVLYLIGAGLKKAEVFENKYIPLGLGLLGALLGAAWLLVFRDAEYNILQSLLMGAVQGILCAGCSVYANQIYKQLKEEKEVE